MIQTQADAFSESQYLIRKECEEDRTHLSISVWHLLMNLKNNYLLKKLLKWANKDVRILIFTMLYFFKKK